MKTKKAILEWWEKLGNKPTDRNDMKDLNALLTFPVSIVSSATITNTKDIEIKTMSHKWKHPLYLYFTLNEHQKYECYRIVGF